jgi:ATP-dependent helicase/nuclease subunit A
VTFTEKAAGEMKLRLRGGLEKARTAEDAPLVGARAWIARSRCWRWRASGRSTRSAQTCCASTRVEAEVDPLFEVGAEDEAERLFDQAFDRWFQRALRTRRRACGGVLRRRSSRRDRRGRARAAARRGLEAVRTPRLHRALAARALRPHGGDDAGSTRLRAIAPVRARRAIGRFPRPRASRSSSASSRSSTGARRCAGATRTASRPSCATCALERVAVARRRLQLPRLAQRGDRAARRREARWSTRSSTRRADLAACLFARAPPSDRGVRAAQSARGRLDFLDLLLHTRDLLRREPRRARGSSRALLAPLHRRVSGHRSSAGRDPAAPRRGRSQRDVAARGRAASRASSSSSAIRSSRSTASGAPTSRSTAR